MSSNACTWTYTHCYRPTDLKVVLSQQNRLLGTKPFFHASVFKEDISCIASIVFNPCRATPEALNYASNLRVGCPGLYPTREAFNYGPNLRVGCCLGLVQAGKSARTARVRGSILYFLIMGRSWRYCNTRPTRGESGASP